MLNKRGHIYTEEEINFLKEYCYGHTRKEIIEAFKQEFGWELTIQQLKGQMRKYNLVTGHTGQFGDFGHYYQGEKMTEERYRRALPTMFKNGHVPKNRVPVGVEKLRSDGFIKVKVAQPDKWEKKHVLVWEAANGPMPSKSCIMFLDRDRSNCDLSNLICISKSANRIINLNKMFGDDPDVNRTMAILAEYMAAAGISNIDSTERGLRLRIEREKDRRKGQHNG